MKDLVHNTTVLDSPYGYAVGRYIVLLRSEDKFKENFFNIICDKEIKGTYTIVREVLYT